MSDIKAPKPAKRTKNSSKPSKPPKVEPCCSLTCCCGCCCKCCRRSSESRRGGGSGDGGGGSSRENSCDRIKGPDDEAHITAINRRPSEVDPAYRKGRKGHGNGSDVTASDQKHGQRCKKCCKSVTAFIFSHVGLCCLVVAYSIMGGFLFQWLESDSEVTERSNVRKVRWHHVERMWNMTYHLNVLHRGNWSKEAEVILQSFQDSIFQAVKEKGWDGRDEHTPERQWSFAGSLLYSITVITTIGYGHIAPKTDMGRLVTMFYALLGIPLTLLCLANIGSSFGNCFRFLYKHICGGLVWLCCPSHYSQRKPSNPLPLYTATDARPEHRNAVGVVVHYEEVGDKSAKGKHGGGGGKSKTKGNNFNNGTNDPANSIRRQHAADEPDATIHAPLAPKRPHGDAEIGGSRAAGVGVRYYPPPPPQQPPPPHCDVSVEERLVPMSKVKAKRKKSLKEEVRVPMLVSLLIIALYIFGGAVMFSLWEKEWNYLIGSYFCFITLSTIGFGDYVFGTGVEWNNNEKLIICAFYLAFGLSIIAMGFDLMQEEVRAKFAWLGAKLGIIDDDSSDDEDDDDDVQMRVT